MEQTKHGTCDSCGSIEVVTLVRRFYVTPEQWDTPGGVTAGDDEWWCATCQTHYPHQVLDAEGNPITDELT